MSEGYKALPEAIEILECKKKRPLSIFEVGFMRGCEYAYEYQQEKIKDLKLKNAAQLIGSNIYGRQLEERYSQEATEYQKEIKKLQVQLKGAKERAQLILQYKDKYRLERDELQKRVEWLEDRLKATDTLSKMRAAVIGSFNTQEFNARTKRKMLLLKKSEQALKGEG